MMKSLRVGALLLCLGIAAFICFAHDSDSTLVEDIPSPGARNAIKKAYQMTDICFTPMANFVANPTKTYHKGEKCKGLVYSSVKETHTYVGMDVSFHTFMTALHNPKSVIYTENVSKPPYHGSNCGAYYGTVCSGLTTYALGLKIYHRTYDFANSNCFQLVDDQSSKGVRLADVINSGGHVQLVTAIKRNPKNGKAEEIEICEGVRPGCRRAKLSGSKLDILLTRKVKKWKLYRYKYLDSVRYTPLTDFVAVGDEILNPFYYNDDICTNRGDKACYIVGDTVALNIAKGYDKMEVYKDSKLYKSLTINQDKDVFLPDLPFGDYKARLISEKKQSDFTYWKMIDVNVKIDTKKKLVRFSSKNAKPVYVDFCSSKGGLSIKNVFDLSDEDIKNGFIDVSSSTSSMKKNKYVRVHFECEYGRVINKPQKWRYRNDRINNTSK